MFSPRRVLVVLGGLLVAGWLAGARGTDPAAPGAGPPKGVTVTVEKTDGATVRGVFGPAVVRVATEYGAADLDVGKIQMLDVSEGGQGGYEVNVTTTDKAHLSGPLLSDGFPVAVGSGDVVTFKPGEVARITFEHPKDPSLTTALVALVTLTVMEVVLGVDNVIFLAILAGKLPEHQRPRARQIGLAAALGTRLLLLFSLTWLLGLTRPLFFLPDLPLIHSLEARGVSWRDIILLAGGMFLIGKSVYEMHEKLEHAKESAAGTTPKPAGFVQVIVWIAIIDIVFSLDSVITAVGMAEDLWVMVTAMVIAMGVMLLFAGPIARFVDTHPTVKVLALSFLILIGVLLVAESLGQHIDKGYIYFAMAFAVAVELVNLRVRGGGNPELAEMPKDQPV
jgi:predicted tellurium resistance membrane protein TerC